MRPPPPLPPPHSNYLEQPLLDGIHHGLVVAEDQHAAASGGVEEPAQEVNAVTHL